jgi:hypothetical protein
VGEDLKLFGDYLSQNGQFEGHDFLGEAAS